MVQCVGEVGCVVLVVCFGVVCLVVELGGFTALL